MGLLVVCSLSFYWFWWPPQAVLSCPSCLLSGTRRRLHWQNNACVFTPKDDVLWWPQPNCIKTLNSSVSADNTVLLMFAHSHILWCWKAGQRWSQVSLQAADGRWMKAEEEPSHYSVRVVFQSVCEQVSKTVLFFLILDEIYITNAFVFPCLVGVARCRATQAKPIAKLPSRPPAPVYWQRQPQVWVHLLQNQPLKETNQQKKSRITKGLSGCYTMYGHTH